jgi:nitrogen fixation/metabolism regulation signal transduction histidine kinase
MGGMHATTHRRNRTRRLLFRTLPLVALLTALLVALLLVSGVQRETAGESVLEDGYLWVLLVTVLALTVLVWSIGYRLLHLLRNVRAGAPGARLAARWVLNFLALSLPPALIVFFFSAWFLTSTIESWFDVRVETALADSLELGQEFLATRTLEVRNLLRETTGELALLQEDGELLRQALLSRVRAAGPTELSVLETDGTLVATANINALTGLPERPGDFALMHAGQEGEYVAPEPTADGGLHIRAILLMPAAFPGGSPRFLQAIYPLPEDITNLTASIEQEYYRYQATSYLRASLRQSFLLILSLVLLLTVMLALLAAMNTARRMVAPLSRLSSATREVAAGDFGREVAVGPRDEIGFLAESFNEMTQALKAASQAAEASRAQLQAQREFLETVLANLSSGVVTLDAQDRLITVNAACVRILGLPEYFAAERAQSRPPGEPLRRLQEVAPWLQPFVETVEHPSHHGRDAWQQEIRLDPPGAPLVLLMRGTRLPLLAPPGAAPVFGQVIVFDDVTILNQAQREAAWAEVARRLAHEVKNPLTPIRLAAERLHMKLAGKLQAGDEAVLERASNTIVSQVEALRKLVDAFGDYAQEPRLSREAIHLDELVREVVALYQQGEAGLQFRLALCPGPAGLAADSGRLRQLLHNLIRNAREAGEEAGREGPVELGIRSSVAEEKGTRWLLLELLDDGPGFPQSVLDKPFEPYVTSKSRGSGLGLAICRKIVAEHNGRIAIANRQSGGARVEIRLPLDRDPAARPDSLV